MTLSRPASRLIFTQEYPAVRVAAAARRSVWDRGPPGAFWLQPWARASNKTLARGEGWPRAARKRTAFSSACFHFGKSLVDAGVPAVGLVEADYPGSRLSEWSPATARGAFERMVAPLAPSKLSGVAWYHGESYTDHYGRDLKRLVRDWRRAFEDPGLYFGVFQLGTQYAPEIRAEQLEVLDLERTGYAATADLGVGGYMDCHPVRKEAAAGVRESPSPSRGLGRLCSKVRREPSFEGRPGRPLERPKSPDFPGRRRPRGGSRGPRCASSTAGTSRGGRRASRGASPTASAGPR